MIAMAGITFLGPLPGWWPITVRPDMGAAVLAGLGLLLVLSQGVRRPGLAALLAGICLAAAWSFKQSCVLIAVGLVLAALIQRRYVAAALLVIPPALAVVGCILGLGPDYLANVAWATSLAPLTWRSLERMLFVFTAKGLLPLAVSVAGVVSLRQAAWVRPDERLVLRCCWITTLLGGLIACSRSGSEANYFFELWMVVGLLAMIEVKLLFDGLAVARGGSLLTWTATTIGLLFCASATLDVARLAGLEHYCLGRLRLSLDHESIAELQRVGKLIRGAEGEVYCQPALCGLAFDPPLPAPNFGDYDYFHKPAAARGLLRGRGLEGLLADHFFPLVVLDVHNERMLATVSGAGYVRQPGWKHILVLEAPPGQGQPQAGRERQLARGLSLRAN